jgi:hypothetical protein
MFSVNIQHGWIYLLESGVLCLRLCLCVMLKLTVSLLFVVIIIFDDS